MAGDRSRDQLQVSPREHCEVIEMLKPNCGNGCTTQFIKNHKTVQKLFKLNSH